jgi:hypothetical protein
MWKRRLAYNNKPVVFLVGAESKTQPNGAWSFAGVSVDVINYDLHQADLETCYTFPNLRHGDVERVLNCGHDKSFSVVLAVDVEQVCPVGLVNGLRKGVQEQGVSLALKMSIEGAKVVLCNATDMDAGTREWVRDQGFVIMSNVDGDSSYSQMLVSCIRLASRAGTIEPVETKQHKL